MRIFKRIQNKTSTTRTKHSITKHSRGCQNQFSRRRWRKKNQKVFGTMFDVRRIKSIAHVLGSLPILLTFHVYSKIKRPIGNRERIFFTRVLLFQILYFIRNIIICGSRQFRLRFNSTFFCSRIKWSLSAHRKKKYPEMKNINSTLSISGSAPLLLSFWVF